MRHLALLLISTLILTACGSTATTQYYQLPDSAFRLPETKNKSITVRVILAESLKNSSLLYQTDAHTVHFAQSNLWAAPLEHSLAAALSNKLNRISSSGFIPASHNLTTHGELMIYLDRFQGRYTGDTEISGYATWQNHPNKTPNHIVRQSFHIITPQTSDGYSAMVESLDKGLNELTEQLIK